MYKTSHPMFNSNALSTSETVNMSNLINFRAIKVSIAWIFFSLVLFAWFNFRASFFLSLLSIRINQQCNLVYFFSFFIKKFVIFYYNNCLNFSWNFNAYTSYSTKHITAEPTSREIFFLCFISDKINIYI